MLLKDDDPLRRRLGRLLDALLVLTVLVIAGLTVQGLLPAAKTLLVRLPALLLPFLLAVAGAVLLEPCVCFFELKLRMRRTAAVVLSILVALVLAAGALVLAGSIMAGQMLELYHLLLEQTDTSAGEVMEGWNVLWQRLAGENSAGQLTEELQKLIYADMDMMRELLSGAAGVLTGALTMLPESLLALAVMSLACFFLLKDRYLIRTFLLGLLPEEKRIRVRSIVGQLLKTFMRFIRAYGLLILCTMLLTMSSLWLLGVPFAFTAGVTAGLLDIMPVVGPGLLFLPWGIGALLLHHTGMGLSVLGVFLLTALARHLLEPKVLGGSIGLHPLVSLLCLYMGFKTFGLAGMLLLPMGAAILMTLFRIGVLHRPYGRDGDEDIG